MALKLSFSDRFFLSLTINLMLVSCVAGVDAFCWDDKFMQNFWKSGGLEIKLLGIGQMHRSS